MRRYVLMLAIASLWLGSAGAAAAHNNTGAARGHYLAQLGSCQACHTAEGGQPFAGGYPVKTPFGVIYAPNITPDEKTGLGSWSFADFYRAMHEGLGKDGQYLYPAFPFPSYTKLTRADVRSIWLYLKTVKPVAKADRDAELNWPYSVRRLMRLWRSRYFTKGTFEPDVNQSQAVNRGAYLVQALAHCGACHSPRNDLGAINEQYALAGATVPVDGWLAPNITSNPSLGIGAWSAQSLKSFLSTGRSEDGMALGPMRDLVQASLQHLTPGDLDAVVGYLETVPARGPRLNAKQAPKGAETNPTVGEKLYHKNCSGCHGDDGHSKQPYYPDLKNNSIVLAPNPNNMLLIIMQGGFEAATKTDPYPYSMPPFGFKLNNQQIAAIANYVRQNWNRRIVSPVREKHVDALR